MRPARKKAANFWALQAIQLKGKPTRLPHACSIAAKPLLHRAVVPTTSWPRPEISGTADTEALPDTVPPKGAAANSGAEDAKKNTDKAATTKPSEAANRSTQSSPAPHVTTARPRHHVDQGNGAPRPPLPIGPANSNWR